MHTKTTIDMSCYSKPMVKLSAAQEAELHLYTDHGVHPSIIVLTRSCKAIIKKGAIVPIGWSERGEMLFVPRRDYAERCLGLPKPSFEVIRHAALKRIKEVSDLRPETHNLAKLAGYED